MYSNYEYACIHVAEARSLARPLDPETAIELLRSRSNKKGVLFSSSYIRSIFEGGIQTSHQILGEQKILDFVKDFDLPKHTINVYSDNTVVKGIVNFSKDMNADLIGLSTHGRSGLSNLFNGSITKSVSKNVLRPLITFKI